MNLEEHILIERFFKGELSADEEKTLLEKRANDLLFNEKFDFEKQLFDNLNDDSWSFIKKNDSKELDAYTRLFQSDETKKLTSILQEVNANYQKINNKKNKRWFLYASAAVIALLICFYVVLNTSSSPLELYASYLDTSEIPSLIARGDENELVNAQRLFEKEMYTEALVLFNEKLSNSDNQYATLALYVGISQMELDQYKDAESTFDTLIASATLDAPKGYWYKALLYLKTNEIEKSTALLRKISSESLYNHAKAKGLLEELN